jgi:hypothetical protein
MSVAVTRPGRTFTEERLAIVRDRSDLGVRAIAAVPWVVLAVFLAGEILLSALTLNGPFYDEGIYVTAGIRTLQGYGLSDNYVSWFTGSLMWPILAALGWKAAGLAGARAVAAICVTIGLAGAFKAAGNLFGIRVRAAAAVAALLSGPLIALGHLAVYDTLSLAAAGWSFWAMTEFLRRDDRAWLCASALLFALSSIFKYPAMIFIGPPLLLLVVAGRRRSARMDLGLFAFISAAVVMIYFLSDRGQLVALEEFRVHNSVTFGVTRSQLLYTEVYLMAVPLLLALPGAFLIERRGIGLALLSGVVGAPAYHLLNNDPTSTGKHVVFGLLFTLPLIGVTLTHALRRWRLVLAIPALIGLAGFAAVQAARLDEAWPDLRPAVGVLTREVHPGERILANSAWVEAAYLYDGHRINSPFDLWDTSRVQALGGHVNVCSFQWFVEVPGGEPWPAPIQAAMRSCGTFRELYHSTALVTGLGTTLSFVTYRGAVEIWKNEPRAQGQSPARSTG